MKDHILGFLLAMFVLFMVVAFFSMPAILWLLILIAAILVGIFVRLGSVRSRS